MAALAKAIGKATRKRWDPTALYAAGEAGALLLFDQPVRSGIARLPRVGGGVNAVADALPAGATADDYSVTSWGSTQVGDPGDSITDNGDGSATVTKAEAGGLSSVWSNQSEPIAVGEVWELECDVVGDAGIGLKFQLADATNVRTTDFTVTLAGSGAETIKGLVLVEASDGTGEFSIRTDDPGTWTVSNARARRVLGVHGVQASTSLRPTREQVDGYKVLRLDHVDDKLVLTFPGGLTGADAYIAGRNGSWLESGVDVSAGGTLDLGPKDSVGGVTQAVQALGDLVGMVVIERALTAAEKALLADYFRGRGAQGLLVESLEEVTGSALYTPSDWTYDGTGVDWSVPGQVTTGGGGSNPSVYQALPAAADAPMARVRFNVLEPVPPGNNDARVILYDDGFAASIDLWVPGDGGGVFDLTRAFNPGSGRISLSHFDEAHTVTLESLSLTVYEPEETARPNPMRIIGDDGAAFLFDQPSRRGEQRVANAYGLPPADAQSVALVADVAGAVFGPDLVTNGTFDADVTGWSNASDGTLAWSAGALEYTSGGGTGKAIQQFLDADSQGAWFFARARAREISGGGVAGIRLETAAGAGFVGEYVSSADWTGLTAFGPLVAGSSGYFVELQVGSPLGTVIEFDDVVVREVTGLALAQASVSLRPTYTVDGNGHGALAFDLVDDVMSATFPSGFSGDVFFAGRNGCWIERDVTVSAGGTLDIGPKGGAFTEGLLEVLGALVAVVCVDHTITATEADNLAAFAVARGGKGLITLGPELVVDGTFSAGIDEWDDTRSTTRAWVDSDYMRVSGGGLFGWGARQVVTTGASEKYLFSVDLVETDAEDARIGAELGATADGVGGFGLGDSRRSDTGPLALMFDSGAGGDTALFLGGGDDLDTHGYDNVSCRKLILPE